jgi:outer membrane protein TolC
MSNFRHINLALSLFLLSSTLCLAHDHAVVDHHDRIKIDKTLTLPQLIDLTLKKFPEQLLNTARAQEADALQQRGNSWLAGAPVLVFRYKDDLPADDDGYREIEGEVELPLWNWGQRSAGQAVAEQAYNATQQLSSAIKLDVTGLVRITLWNMELENIRHDQAKSILDISEKLLGKIKRRVELGDLPRSDLLLAQSDHLQKRSLLVQAEAEMMHARKNYISLTQMTNIPADYEEQLSPLIEIPENHPKLIAINAVIQRKQAELDWVESAGSGQPNLFLGGKSEREDRHEGNIESMSFGISIPFGGSAHLAPEIAAANLELTEALTQRAYLFRELEKQHHEAKHALEVTEAELKIANELNKIAESHLKMAQLSFSAGEINLMDLLKIQARSFNAIRHAKEHKVMLQKNIALYNQAVGVLP